MTKLPNTLAAAPEAIANACAATSKTMFDSAERLAVLNLNTARGLVDDGSAAARALLAVKSPQDLAALQSATVRPTGEKVIAYYRGCYEILAQGMEEVVKPFEMQMAELNKLVAATLEKAAKSAPGGSDVALAAVQSAIAAANTTYDSVSKATRKAIAIAESSFNASTTAVAKAASSTVEAAVAAKSA